MYKWSKIESHIFMHICIYPVNRSTKLKKNICFITFNLHSIDKYILMFNAWDVYKKHIFIICLNGHAEIYININ